MADRTPRVQQLDDISRAIIEHLQADGRRSYADIGKAVGLSETAVRNRVQRLVDAGVMQIVAVTDPLQLGFARQAMVGIRTSGDSTRIAAEVSALPEVTYVVLTAGSFDEPPRVNLLTVVHLALQPDSVGNGCAHLLLQIRRPGVETFPIDEDRA